MTLDDLLKPEKERGPLQDELMGTQYANEGVHYLEFHKYLQTQGIDNITTKHMNQLVERYGDGIMSITTFKDYYNIISSNESNKIMIRWTKAIGLMTVVVVIATVVMLFKT